MVLPGITKLQMIEVDRIMMDELRIPVELMMEQAGFHLASLAAMANYKSKPVQIISGSGNNGGGGLVAARRLKAWGLNVEVFIPRGINNLHSIGLTQLNRLHSLNVPILETLPVLDSEKTFLIDAYLGYGYTKRTDHISDSVFEILSNHPQVLCLDVPSGFDSDTGVGIDDFKPLATLTIAFPKNGLLIADKEQVGTLYVCDIGVPMSIYKSRLGIEWTYPFQLEKLGRLLGQFEAGDIVKIKKSVDRKTRQIGWKYAY